MSYQCVKCGGEISNGLEGLLQRCPKGGWCSNNNSMQDVIGQDLISRAALAASPEPEPIEGTKHPRPDLQHVFEWRDGWNGTCGYIHHWLGGLVTCQLPESDPIHLKLCRTEFLAEGQERGICQLDKGHKGSHDNTVRTPKAAIEGTKESREARFDEWWKIYSKNRPVPQPWALGIARTAAWAAWCASQPPIAAAPEWLDDLEKAAEAATQGPWHWSIEDYSTANLQGVQGELEHILSSSPCKSCQTHAKEPKEWEFGRCTTPDKADADYIAKANPAAILELIKLVRAALPSPGESQK